MFAPQKVPFLKISVDVIACDLWFGPPPNQKSWLRLCAGLYLGLRKYHFFGLNNIMQDICLIIILTSADLSRF